MKRRFMALMRIFCAFFLVFSILPPLDPSKALAAELDDVNAIKSKLQAFMDLGSALSGFEELGDALPLSQLDPSGPDALRLVQLFSDPVDSLKQRLLAGAPTTYDTLKNLINSLDGTYGGVDVQASGPVAGNP